MKQKSKTSKRQLYDADQIRKLELKDKIQRQALKIENDLMLKAGLVEEIRKQDIKAMVQIFVKFEKERNRLIVNPEI